MSRPRATRPAGLLWVLRTGLAALALLAAGCAQLQPPRGQAPGGEAALPPTMVLDVQAPAPLKALLTQHLDVARLTRLRTDETVDASEWSRLLAAAPAQARELLQTEGYFDAQARISRSDDTPPTVTVHITPGERTVVSTLSISPEGALADRLAAGDAAARALKALLDSTGPLRPGQPFRNADWAETKLQLLTRLRAAGHAAATVRHSQADIDVAGRSAQLSVALDSGPLFRAGTLQVEGLQRHELRTVQRLAGFGPGAALTESMLLDYQERLQKSGLFDAVSVNFDPDATQADRSTVSVRLHELPLQQATVGVGYSANTGPRTSLEHTHRRPFNWPLTAYNKIEWGRDAQHLTSDFYSHPGEDFARNLLGVQVERVRGQTDVVLSQRLRVGRTTDTPRVERLYFGEMLRSRQSRLAGDTVDAQALSANLHLVLRALDSVLLPTRGYSLSLQLGAGQARSNTGDNGPFGRVYGRLTGYWPLGAQWYGNARVEAGQVVKRDAVTVPDALGFRAGGDDSVRGYGWRTLAPQRAGALVSGNVLLTGSVELARPVSASMPALWGALFVDAGRAAERWSDYKPALGYGVGLRWRSPIGPLRADLAWGDELRRARLHVSVGIVF